MENRNKAIYLTNQPIIPANFALLFRNAFPNFRIFGFYMLSFISKLSRVEGSKAHTAFLLDQDIIILENMKINNLFSSTEKFIFSLLHIGVLKGLLVLLFYFNKNSPFIK